MRINSALSTLALAAAMIAGAAHAQGALQPGGPGGGPGGPGGPGGKMPPMAKTVEIQMHIEAGSGLKQPYPGAAADTVTWHHGTGFLAPFGEVEYYCGQKFPEEAQFPVTDWQNSMFTFFTGRGDPLFCTYTTTDGTFYVRDSVSGTVAQYPDGGGRNMMFEVVVGGTGKYKDATGVWTGYTEGVGRPAKGDRAPKVLLKVMTGYVKLPNDK